MSKINIKSKNKVTNGDNTLLENLSVIIPTIGRQRYAIRAVTSWTDTLANIIVIDGSDRPIAPHILRENNKLKSFTYIHLRAAYSKRMAVAAEHIKTKYAISMCDDEFYLKTGLAAAINRLEEEDEAVGCIGQSLRFNYDPDGIIRYSKGYPTEGYVINSNNPSERIYSAMKEYNAATCYAVLRTESWKDSFGRLRCWSNPYAIELQQAFLTYISGKFISSPEVYWMRSDELSPINGIENWDRNTDFSTWYSSAKNHIEANELVEILAKALASKSYIEEYEAKQIISDGFKTYINFELKERRHGRAVWLHKTIQLIKRTPFSHLINIARPIVKSSEQHLSQCKIEMPQIEQLAKTSYGQKKGIRSWVNVSELEYFETHIRRFYDQVR